MHSILSAEVQAISEEVGNVAVIQLGESRKDSEGWFVPRPTGPSLPVGKVLERLGIIRPKIVPAVGCVLLAPAVHEA